MISNFKIVADSSADMLRLKDVEFESTPLKIITDVAEYIDDENLDVEKMTNDLRSYKGRSSTSCPSSLDYFDAFGGAQYVFCVTITSKLSGSYNSAILAKNDYEEKFPERKVFVIDSLSAGPGLRLLVEKLKELAMSELAYDKICEEIISYKERLALYFSLENLNNLANNGRVNPAVAKMATMFGIRIVGKEYEGELKPLLKCCGEKKALEVLFDKIVSAGYKGGKVRIAHCGNENAALKIASEIRKKYEESDIKVYKTRGLCSFYAENGGLLIGFEK